MSAYTMNTVCQFETPFLQLIGGINSDFLLFQQVPGRQWFARYVSSQVIQFLAHHYKSTESYCCHLDISVGALAFASHFLHQGFCLACKAEARHMYCFSDGFVCGGVNFCRVFAFRSFSQKL